MANVANAEDVSEFAIAVFVEFGDCFCFEVVGDHRALDITAGSGVESDVECLVGESHRGAIDNTSGRVRRLTVEEDESFLLVWGRCATA